MTEDLAHKNSSDGNWMAERIRRFGEKTVFVGKTGSGETQQCSYHALHDKIIHWQGKLTTSGIEAGQVVAVIGDFNPDAAALLIALLANNNIVVPLTDETAAKHARFFSLANVNWCLTMDAHSHQWQQSKIQPDNEHQMISGLKSRQEAGLVLFTSGTSGESKGAVLKASSLLQRFEHMAIKPEKALRCLVFLKLDHIGGLNTLFSIIFSGGTAISIKDRSAQEVCQTIAEHRAQLLPTTPTFLNMLLLSGVRENHDLSSLKVITYGTEPMPMSTLIAMNQAFPQVNLKQTYGLTELGIFSTRSKQSDSDWLKIGGEGVETRVEDGILQIKTPSSMLGYLNAPSPFTEDGFYVTGDRVEIDGEYYRILGRDSEIINVGGEKVYPSEVESILLEIPNIEEVLVSGKKSPVTGNIVCVSVVLGEEESRAELVSKIHAFCKPRLEGFKIPKIVSISKTSFMSARLKKARNQPTATA